MVRTKQDSAFWFGGGSTSVTIQDDSSLWLDQYTIEVWIKMDGVPQTDLNCIVNKGNSYGIWVNKLGGISHRFGTTYGSNIESNSERGVIFPDKWYHIAVTNDGSTAKIYVDGELKKEDSVQGTILPARDTPLIIGGDAEQAGLKGHITELRLWGKARPQGAIQEDMFERLVGDEVGLVGYWPLTRLYNGRVVVDLNVNGNHGIPFGPLPEGQLAPMSPVGEGIHARQYVVRYPHVITDSNNFDPSLEINNVPPLTHGITVACWAKSSRGKENFSPYATLVVRTDGSSNYVDHVWMLRFDSSSRISFGASTETNGYRVAQYDIGPSNSVAQWHHYAGTFDGSVVRLFFDGEEVATSQNPGKIRDVNQPIKLGYRTYFHHQDSTHTYPRRESFPGDMAQVQLWNRALSEEAICETMFKALNGDEEQLVGYWLLNEGEGNIAADTTNYSHYGYLSAGSYWEEQLPIGINSGNWGGGTSPGEPSPGGPGSGIGGSTESGKSYQITSASSKVLTVLGNVGYDSADVQGGVNLGTDGQKWLITEDGSLKSHLGEFALDMVPTDDDPNKQSVQIKALDPSSPTQKWELTADGHLKNKTNGFVVVMLEFDQPILHGRYFVDAFAPSVIFTLPYWGLKSYEYTWQFQEV